MGEHEHTAQLTWTPGQGGIQQVQTVPRDERKVWGWVTVTGEPSEYRVTLDGNTGPDLGPIDVPCIVATELPVTLLVDRFVTPRPATQGRVGVAWGHGCPPARDRGRVLSLLALVPTALAPWESEADLTNPAATADWLTAGGIVISTFAGRGYRPLGATQIRLSLNTDVRIRA